MPRYTNQSNYGQYQDIIISWYYNPLLQQRRNDLAFGMAIHLKQ